MGHPVQTAQLFDRRYRLEAKLGSGEAEVFRAADVVSGQTVALKVLAADRGEILRGELERLTTCLHPNLVRPLDLGRATLAGKPVAYLTTELIAGPTLRELASSKRFEDVAPVLADALEALAWLHAQGVHHGDFKPENVLAREEEGGGVLIDLSAASALGSREGVVSGTATFVAPELLRGQPTTRASDLYAVGRTLAVLEGELGVALPASIQALAEALLSADPARRPTDAGDLARRIAPRGGGVRRVFSPDPPRMLGREAELDRVEGAIAALHRRAEGPRSIEILGERGIGKSRLLREIKWRAQRSVAWVEASPWRSGAVAHAVERASGKRADSLDELLSAHAALGDDEPVIFAVDGADDLDERDRALLGALVRAARPPGRVMWIVTSREPVAAAGATIRLGVLDLPAVGAWLDRVLTSPRSIEEAHRVTGGHPTLLRALAGSLAAGALRELDLPTFEPERTLGAVLRDRLAALEPEARIALAALVAAARPIDDATAAELAITPAALRACVEVGLARREGTRVRLAVDVSAKELRALLPPALVSGAARGMADRAARAAAAAEGRERSARLAEQVLLTLRAGDAAAALSLAAEAAPLFEWAASEWALATQELVAGTSDPEAGLLAASAVELAGDPKKAISILARTLRARPARSIVSRARLLGASCSASLGRVERAIGLSRRSETSGSGRRSLVEARSLLRAGRYREALAAASQGLDSADTEPRLMAELYEVRGVAESYLGDPEAALADLRIAGERGRGERAPRSIFRSQSYLGFVAYRSGETELAARAFSEAHAIADREALGDLAASAALNVGTAQHQLGDWGGALASYEKGLRAAVAFAKERTEATLRFNLAKLASDIGLFERAERERGALAGGDGKQGANELAVASLGLGAEIAAARGAPREALALLADAAAIHQERGAKREICETAIHAAEIELDLGDAAAATKSLAVAGALLPDLDAVDLELRLATAHARLDLAEGRVEGALAHARRGSASTARARQLELEARHEEVVAAVYRRRSASALADRHRRAAIECWERIASSLPEEMLDAFWRHPKRARLRATEPAERAPSRRLDMTMRVLEINRRLSSTLDVEEVLRVAMDAAIELTGAERGFVILEEGGKLRVAVARNLDKESVGRSQLKFSQGIARRVVESGAPILTVDATSDERFATNRSIHGLKLRSIVCVPIRAHGRVLGALYLDNRFQRGRFDAEDADLLGVFADQVAVALHNGRLMAELRERTAALEAEQRRVAELMHSQASEIERLSHELERERSQVGSRREFPEIVGASRAMERVLSLVSRVAASDIPVTITGESGTGKELVARAIHGERAASGRPFVAINCAALPEGLLESELFGHVRGAFTGAVRDHQGLFVAASGGTLFLDEIGEMPLSVQAKLLRVLQEREVRPVGADRAIPVADVRVVCATNRVLRAEVAAGNFREDLYYRIQVIEISLPPLRDRLEDVPALARAILDKLAARQGRTPWRLSPAALRKLAGYAWPGNIRELENVLARGSVLALSDELGPAEIELPSGKTRARRSRNRAEHRQAEAERIREALELHRWNVCEVSRLLDIPRTTLYRKLGRYGLLRS